MNIKVRMRYLLMVTSVILMAACNGGSQSQAGGSPSVQSVAVPSSLQVRTPVSANTNLGTNSSTSLSNMKRFFQSLRSNSCIQLVTQPNGRNYTTAINSSAWWSTANVTVGITNTCSTAQAFTATVVFNNVTMNGGALPSNGWSIQPSGSPYMTVKESSGGSNPQFTVSTPVCTPLSTWDGCSWAQLAPGATITVTANLGYSSAINSFNIGSVAITEVDNNPATQTTGSVSLNLAATSQTTQACASATCNFQVNLISPAGVVVQTSSINAGQTGSGNYLINNLLPGQYTLQVVPASVPSLSGGVITYTYSPSTTIAVGAGSTAATAGVNFTYTANPPAPAPGPNPAPTPTPVNELNSITVNLSTKGVPAIFKNNTILGRILDSSNTQIATMSFNSQQLSQTITSSSFVAGQTYTLQVQALGDPQSGTYYKSAQAQFVVQSGKTVVPANPYGLIPSSQLYSIQLSVPTPVAGQTLSYGADPAADTGSTSYISFVADSVVAGWYEFPSELVTTVTLSTPAGYNVSVADNLSGTVNNIITSASAGAIYTITNTQAPAGLTYQVYYAANNSTSSGIGNSYNLVITNNSSQTLNLTQMLFTLRSDAAMHNIITAAQAPNGGTLAGYKIGQCYGVNNGVCDVNYTFNIGWGNPTSLAPGASITLTGFPNGNSQTQGGSTSDGLPLYLDAAHNVVLVDTAGHTYPAAPYTIYPNLQNPNPNKMVGGYFTDWANYSTPSGRMFPVESAGLNSFPVKTMNTMVYDLMYINGGSQSNGVVSGTAAGDVALADNWADPTYVEEFSYMRAAHPWMDMTISFGGWGSGNPLVGYPSENLQLIFETYYNNGGPVNQAVINSTAQNMINAALMFGFNGVDIDFEEGECSNTSQSWCVGGTISWNTASIRGYEALLTALYSYATQITTTAGSPLKGSTFNISTALPAGVDTMQKYARLAASGNFDNVLNNITYGNIMAYDYHGQWDAGGASPMGVNDANAPLYGSNKSGYTLFHNYAPSVEQYYDIYDTLLCGATINGTLYRCTAGSNTYQGYFGFNSSITPANIAGKLNLGIPTYTRVENLNTASSLNSAIYQTLGVPQTWQTAIGGAVSYRCIYNSGGTGIGGYCAPGKQDILPAAVTASNNNSSTGSGGWGTTSPAQTPWFYLSSGNYFGTYDDKASTVNKIQKMNQAVANIASGNSLNGAFLWEVDEDIPVQDQGYTTSGLMYGICTGTPGSGSCN